MIIYLSIYVSIYLSIYLSTKTFLSVKANGQETKFRSDGCSEQSHGSSCSTFQVVDPRKGSMVGVRRTIPKKQCITCTDACDKQSCETGPGVVNIFWGQDNIIQEQTGKRNENQSWKAAT